MAYIYSETLSNQAIEDEINKHIEGSVTSVNAAELDPISVNAAASDKVALDHYLANAGREYMGESPDLTGTHRWGAFSSADAPDPAVIASDGDTGFDTTINLPVYVVNGEWVTNEFNACAQITRRISSGITSQEITETSSIADFADDDNRSTAGILVAESSNSLCRFENITDTVNGDVYYANCSMTAEFNINSECIIELIHNNDGVEIVLGESRMMNGSTERRTPSSVISDTQFTTGTTGEQTVYAKVYSITSDFTLNWYCCQLNVHK